MNMRSLVLSAAIVGQVLAACNAAPATIAPTEPPTLAPAVPPPTPVPTADPRCPKPTADTQLLTHEEDGYCFLYPDGLLRVDSSQRALCLVPEGSTLGCQDFVAAVEVTDAEGRAAAQIADEKMLSEGGFGADRCTAPIAA